MASPETQQPQTSRTAARRRQRSTRLTVAVALLGVAAFAVVAAALSGSALLITLAAGLAVVLGAAATRITHTEVITARVEAAHERAGQAQAYRQLTEKRTAENARFAKDMRRKIDDREEAITVLEQALSSEQLKVAAQTRKLGAEARRATAANQARFAAESRAAKAAVRIGELEAELDVVRAEVDVLKGKLAQRQTKTA